MANLSSTLEGVSSVARVVDAPSSAGSGLSTAVNSLAKGFDTALSAINKNAQRKRQDAAEARANEDQAWDRENRARTRAGWAADDYAASTHDALNDAALPQTSAANVTTDATPAFASELPGLADVDQLYVNDASRQLKTTQVSVTQGGLPAIALDGLANKLFNAGLARGIPAGLLAKSFKENGVDAFHGYDDATANALEMDKARREERATALKQGFVALGPTAEGMSEDDVVKAGRQQLADQAVLEAASKNASMQATLNSDKRATTNDVREQADRDSTNAGFLAFSTAADPFLQNVLRTANPASAPERGSDTTYEMKQAKVVATTTQYLAELKTRTLNKMRLDGFSPSAINAAEASIDQRTKDVLGGLNSGGQAFQQGVTLISQSFGLRMRETMPVVSAFKAAGIDYTQIPGIVQAISPDVKKRLGAELSQIFSNGVVDSAEKVHLKNIIAVATGKANLTDIDSTVGKKALIGDASRYVAQNTKAIANGRGDGETFMSFKRQIALGASTLTAQESAANLRNAAGALVGEGTIDAINKLRSNGGTAEEATLLGSATRGSAARLLSAAHSKMGAVLQSGLDKYQILNYNEKTGQWGFVFNDRLWNANLKGSGGYAPTKPDGPSAEAQQLLDTMNGSLHFLTRTSDWDEETKGDTFRDVANYYAKGTPLPSQVKAAQTKKSKGSIYDIQDSVIEAGSHIPDVAFGSADNADIIGPEGAGKNPRSSAQGIGQFTNSTWLNVMRKHAPELIDGKSDADILAMRENKALATKAVGWYRGDNAAHLASQGLPSGRTATAIAHFAGPEGAARLFKSDPNAPVESALGEAAVKANPQLRGKTVAEAIDWAKRFYHA